MQTGSRRQCHDSPEIGVFSERGVEAIELALVTALFVVVIVAVFPLLAGGVDAAFQSVIEAFATANAGEG